MGTDVQFNFEYEGRRVEDGPTAGTYWYVHADDVTISVSYDDAGICTVTRQ